MTSRVARGNSMTLLALCDLNASTDRLIFHPNQLTDRNLHEETQVPSLTVVSRTSLEDLSNELLIDIFQYVSLYDLHRAVYNLNRRLNVICEVQKFCLDLDGWKRVFDYYCAHQSPMASQIYSLKINDSYDRLIKFDQCNSLELFINLRMLSIRESSSQHLEKILPKLCKLSHLSYLNISSPSIRSSNITAAFFQIRSLKRLILDSINPITLQFDDQSIHPLTELEYLEIDICPVSILLGLLRYVGSKIKHLRIRLCYEARQNEIFNDSVIDDQWVSLYPVLASLRRLEIKFSWLSLRDFHSLLRLFPRLTHLVFDASPEEIDFISPSLWYEFISTHLLELAKLQFHIKIQGHLGNSMQCLSTEFVDCFHFMNRKWLAAAVVMDYNSLLRIPVLEFYTFPQSAHHRKCDLQLYGTKRYVACSAKNILLNIDRDIANLQVTFDDNEPLSQEVADSYPKVTQLTICAQTNIPAGEQDVNSKLIISDIIRSVPDLSKITTVNFVTNSSIDPPAVLVRRLLSKMTKLTGLIISYNHLLHLLNFPLIALLLHKKIESLSIAVEEELPILPDIVEIFKTFSSNLRFLTVPLRVNSPAMAFDLVLALICGKVCPNLYSFQLSLYSQNQQQPQVFDEPFKQKLKDCLRVQTEKNQARLNPLEYSIRDNVLSVSF